MVDAGRRATGTTTEPTRFHHGGHLFVIRTDVTRLDCDALLISTDDRCSIQRYWDQVVGRVGYPQPWSDDSLVQWARTPTDGPTVAFGRVALDERPGAPVSAEQRVERASQVAEVFIEQAAECLLPRSGQRRPRVALPLIGTGRGGLGAAPGDLLRPLLQTLRVSAERTGVDVVLAVVDPVAWGAIQQVRRGVGVERPEPGPTPIADQDGDLVRPNGSWWNLDDGMVALSDRLIQHARDEQLVLFIGAGVSRDAGAPDWNGLLDAVARDLGIDPQQDDEWRQLDPRDRARLLERQADLNGKHSSFRSLVVKHVSMERFGLTHALLASLRVEAAVTTNYDTLYEAARRLPETQPPSDELAVLPYESVVGRRPWLLKLHGDSDHSDVVITRADYLHLNRHGGALFGIVQAMLVTRHLLFVGYSLSDEDFHALVDEIEAALNPKVVKRDGADARGNEADADGVARETANPERDSRASLDRSLGTALVLENVSWGDLWSGTIDIRRVGDSPDVGENARTLQIALDRVNAYSVDGSAHVLDRRFDGLLDDDEREVVGSIRDLAGQLKSLPVDSDLRVALTRSLRDLGYDEP